MISQFKPILLYYALWCWVWESENQVSSSDNWISLGFCSRGTRRRLEDWSRRKALALPHLPHVCVTITPGHRGGRTPSIASVQSTFRLHPRCAELVSLPLPHSPEVPAPTGLETGPQRSGFWAYKFPPVSLLSFSQFNIFSCVPCTRGGRCTCCLPYTFEFSFCFSVA